MSCPREEELSRRHDGELSGPGLAELESHILDCLACREYAGKLRTLDQLLTGPLAIASRNPASRGRRRRRTTLWFAAASAAVLLAVFGVATRVKPSPAKGSVIIYQMASPQGHNYHITVEGEARLLSIEIDGAVAHFPQEDSP